MKLEDSRVVHPAVSPSGCQRTGDRQKSSITTLTKKMDDITSLTSRVANIRINKNSKQIIQDGLLNIENNLANISLNHIHSKSLDVKTDNKKNAKKEVLNICENVKEVALEDDKENAKKEVLNNRENVKEVKVEDDKENAKKVGFVIGENVKAVKEEDIKEELLIEVKVETSVGDEKNEAGTVEEGGLLSRGPMRGDHCTARSVPYNQIQSNYGHLSVGRCLIQEPDYDCEVFYPTPSIGYNNWYANFNIGPDEDSGASSSPLDGSEASSPTDLLTASLFLPGTDLCEDEGIQTDFSDIPDIYDDVTEISDLDNLFQTACKNPSLQLVVDRLSMLTTADTHIPTTVADYETAPMINNSMWNYDINVPSVGGTSSTSGYISSRSTDSPSPGTSSTHNMPAFTYAMSPESLRSPTMSTYISDNSQGSLSPPNMTCAMSPESLRSPNMSTYVSDHSQGSLSPPHVTYAMSPGSLNSSNMSTYASDSSSGRFIQSPLYEDLLASPLRCWSSTSVQTPRKISPKPQRSTLSSAKSRLSDRLDETMKKKRWATVSVKSDEELTGGDEEGDTFLFILLLKTEKQVTGKLEWVYALVERLRLIPGALTAVNMQQQSAMELSAMFYPGDDRALVTRYIAETLVKTGADLNQLNAEGEGLLHILCAGGDVNCDVMTELISVQHGRRPAFDINKSNIAGLSPLHVAVMNHSSAGNKAVKIVRLLISAGAEITNTANDTSLLHLAVTSCCDPHLVTALLTAPLLSGLAQIAPYREATLLHHAAARNDVPLDQQAAVCKLLLEAGWKRDSRDEAGRCPLDLVDKVRRERFNKLTKI